MHYATDQGSNKAFACQQAVPSVTTHPCRRCWFLLPLLFALSLPVKAQTGTVTFVGAIVVPTCQAGPALSPVSAVSSEGSLGSCGVVKDKSVGFYHLTQTPITAHTSDALLNYFFHYTVSGTDQHQPPVLMTLDYE
jgi:hypothetical protein